MSKFFEELWESIFTPGTTPSLLLATNVSFFFLQVVLGALLLATYSVHFVVLSILCAGLWWAINWFANEVAIAQKEKDEREEEQRRKDRRRAAITAATAAEDDSDTEVEAEKKDERSAGSGPAGKTTGASVGSARQRGKAAAAAAVATAATSSTAAAAAESEAEAEAEAAPAATERESTVVPETMAPNSQESPNARQRIPSSLSGVSTEDEWEKVSDIDKEDRA